MRLVFVDRLGYHGRCEVIQERSNGVLVCEKPTGGTIRVRPEDARDVERKPNPLPVLDALPSSPPLEGGPAQPKTPPARDAAYLAFVRTLPCCVCNLPNHTESHHAPAPGHGAKGLKCSDYRAIPLCLYCHRRHHGGTQPFEADWIEAKITETQARWPGEVPS